MVALTLEPENGRLDFLKWVSERNTHISIEMLHFLIDLPYLPGDEFGEEDGLDEDEPWEIDRCAG